MQILGHQFIGFSRSEEGNGAFYTQNPMSNTQLPEPFWVATENELERATDLANKAFQRCKDTTASQRASFLNAIADEIFDLGTPLLERASAETALPLSRLQLERTRTIFQLQSCAEMLLEGSWVEASIDTANATRNPTPKIDIRKMLVPIGVVAVFGASNFPLAYSVAGVDSAAAWAAGCPVIVKAHPAHAGTSDMIANAVIKAARRNNMPEGIFSMLFDDDFDTAQRLVKHPAIKAVGFTGSFNGGMALYRLAQERPDPIPFFAEMGSLNPIILFPNALKTRAKLLAEQCANSICLNMGQFCTKPGLIFAIQSPELEEFIKHYKQLIVETVGETMLSAGTFQHFLQKRKDVLAQEGVDVLAVSSRQTENAHNQSIPTIARVAGAYFLNNPALQEEVFGAFSLLIVCQHALELEQCLEKINGQLTLSLMIEDNEIPENQLFIKKIIDKVGRVNFNTVPTGVEVCASMQHGGAFPASTDIRFGSVGRGAVRRFLRPLAFQNCPQSFLPDALKDSNPLHIWRLVNNEWKK